MQKISLASFFLILLTACSTKEKVFLDYELGMSEKEYNSKTEELAKSSKIYKLSDYPFVNYKFILKNGSEVESLLYPYIESDILTSLSLELGCSIQGKFEKIVNENDLNEIIKLYTDKYGVQNELNSDTIDAGIRKWYIWKKEKYEIEIYTGTKDEPLMIDSNYLGQYYSNPKITYHLNYNIIDELNKSKSTNTKKSDI